MIDLRSDTADQADPGDARGDGPRRGRRRRLRRGPDGRRRCRSGSPAMFGKEAALFTPTGSMANVLAVAALVGPGQEVLCESRAHIVRAELGAHGALTGTHQPDLVASRTGRSTWRRSRGCTPRTWARSSCAPTAVSVENTHNFAGGIGAADRRPAGAARLGRPRSAAPSTSTAPGSGTPTSRPARRSPTTARSPTPSRCACPRVSARRSARWCWARAETIAEARVRRKRLGGGMRQVGVLAAAGLLRPGPPPRPDGRGPRARPADRRGVWRRSGHGADQHRRGRRALRAGRRRGGGRAGSPDRRRRPATGPAAHPPRHHA